MLASIVANDEQCQYVLGNIADVKAIETRAKLNTKEQAPQKISNASLLVKSSAQLGKASSRAKYPHRLDSKS